MDTLINMLGEADHPRTKEEKYGTEGEMRKKENYCKHKLMRKGLKEKQSCAQMLWALL